MSLEGFYHGTRLHESSENPVFVEVANTSVVGLIGTAPDADPDQFPLNTPVLLKGIATDAQGIGDTGTLKDAIDDVFDQIGVFTVVVRVEEGADITATHTNLIGDATQLAGVHAFKKAQSMFGVTPRLIALPGFSSSDGTTANPVVAELSGVLDELGAVAFVDGPNTDDETAVNYRTNIGSQRIYIVDPNVLVWDDVTGQYVERAASARFAGIQARVDQKLGFWHSLSNKPINGIGGVARSISYGKHANYLNENHIGTIINNGSGFITWGNRSATNDSMWQFLSVRRTADFINEAMEKAYLEFVDKPFSAANLKLMLESGNAAMRRFKEAGAIIGGRVWIDENKNEPSSMANGKIVLSMEFEPPAPMEDIGFLAHRNIGYYLELTKEALKAAA